MQASLVRQLGEDDTLQVASHQPPCGRRRACGSDPSGKMRGPSRQLGCSRALGLDCTPPELPAPHQHGRRLCPPEGSPLLPPLREFSCLARSEPSPPRAGLWGWNVALAGRQPGACRLPSSISCPPLRSRSGATSSGPTTTSCRSCGRARLPAPSSCTCVPRAPRLSTSFCSSEACLQGSPARRCSHVPPRTRSAVAVSSHPSRAPLPQLAASERDKRTSDFLSSWFY